MRLDSDVGHCGGALPKSELWYPIGDQTSNLAKDPSQISRRGIKLASLVSDDEALGNGACSRWGVPEFLVAY